MLLHKKVCELYGINRNELAEMLGVAKTTLDSWSDQSRMTKASKFTLELMIDNFEKTALLKSLRDNFSKLNAFDSIKTETMAVSESGSSKEVSDVHKELIDRINFILLETNTNIIEASRKMRSESFEELDKILKMQIYPSNSFLRSFSISFSISYDWLISGNGHPFEFPMTSVQGRKNISLNTEKIYLFYNEDEKDGNYLKGMLQERDGNFFSLAIGLSLNFDTPLNSADCLHLADLYEIFDKCVGIISFLSLTQDEYDKICSKDFYPKEILDKAKTSNLLQDLFLLKYSNKDQYGKYFAERLDFLKKIEKEERNKPSF